MVGGVPLTVLPAHCVTLEVTAFVTVVTVGMVTPVCVGWRTTRPLESVTNRFAGVARIADAVADAIAEVVGGVPLTVLPAHCVTFAEIVDANVGSVLEFHSMTFAGTVFVTVVTVGIVTPVCVGWRITRPLESVANRFAGVARIADAVADAIAEVVGGVPLTVLPAHCVTLEVTEFVTVVTLDTAPLLVAIAPPDTIDDDAISLRLDTLLVSTMKVSIAIFPATLLTVAAIEVLTTSPAA